MKRYTMILRERESIVIKEERRKILRVESPKLGCTYCMKTELRTSIAREVRADIGSILVSVSRKANCLNTSQRKEIISDRREQRKEIRKNLLNYILENI